MTEFKWIRLPHKQPPEGLKVIFTNQVGHLFVARLDFVVRLDEDSDFNFRCSIICDCEPMLKLTEALMMYYPLYWSFIPGLNYD